MSFSNVLTHNWYASESAGIRINENDVTIYAEDPASNMREEVYLPGIRLHCDDDNEYRILKKLPDIPIPESAVTRDKYAHNLRDIEDRIVGHNKFINDTGLMVKNDRLESRYADAQEFHSTLLKALPIINGYIAIKSESLLPDVLMVGTIQMGCGNVLDEIEERHFYSRVYKPHDVAFTITHGEFVQFVTFDGNVCIIDAGRVYILETKLDVGSIIIDAANRASC